ncbi:hypothetical protein K6D_27160 (plasmid) [Enterococcus faecium]|nr:hypothetical protein K6D_27160 [Enterococcus faecium]
MNESQFLRTMIETLKWDGEDYEQRDKILSILRYAEIDFKKTTHLTRKSPSLIYISYPLLLLCLTFRLYLHLRDNPHYTFHPSLFYVTCCVT